MNIGIVILNWNGLKDTLECLNSLKSTTYPNFFVTVIDNGSRNNEAELILDMFGDFAEVIRLPENLGYAKGNNFGIKHVIDKGADAVLLLNNDVVVEKNFLDYLVEKLKQPNVGIVGPKIFYFSDKNKLWFGGGDFHWWTGLAFHHGENNSDSPKYNITKEASFITGCSMLIKKDVLNRIGYLDEEYPLYWEDADFCYRARKNGFELWYVPESIIWHKVSQSVGEGTPKRSYLVTKSRMIFMKKNLFLWQWPIFSIIFIFYKIPLKIISYLVNGKTDNLKAFFSGIKDGLLSKNHKLR